MKKAILILLAGFGLQGCAIIDTGHRGLKIQFGKVVGQPMTEGFYTYNPLTEGIREFETRTKKLQESATTYTKDVQKVVVEYAVNFNLNPAAVGMVYTSTGGDFEEVILAPSVTGIIKDTVGNWDAVELNGNREQAAQEILRRLQPALANKGLTISDFQIMGLKFEQQFEEAVERKVTAIQRAEEAKNKTEQIRQESEQKVIAAKAEAEAMKIKTVALAQSPVLVDYEAVQRWDGKLPTTMVPGSTLPFLNLNRI